ncbi:MULTISPECIES: CoA transferase [Cycloclasticus]|jgi:crotonobetainyl-CoA:carnitine CoA-transferase CaiB-like acyl-CoA transferase|uniref:CaiB/BaiF CoA transferase family protein n=1 Tax=Cycloclasticus TaxID=34067 RepID=UPI000366DFA6|nr:MULTISPECIES: CoA transferase [Cycloclasticus]PHR48300.1 MAG: CoA transferase [Cycloclasticus sp.]
MSDKQEIELPLSGVRVYEIGTSVAAPFGTWILAALGAEVIKVEPEGRGDDCRHWGPPFWNGTSAMFQALNRDKKSVTVDLKDPEDKAWLRNEIVTKADVVLQNMRPGKVTSLGLGAEEMRKENPKLVYCNIWAFGETGPMADKPGYDPLMQAYSGLMSLNGEEGRPPVRIGTSAIDMGTGMWCSIAIISALFNRQKTGEGCVVDTALYETALSWMTYHMAGYHATGSLPTPQGSGVQGISPYQAYECSDGYLVVAAPNNKLFDLLKGVMGNPAWADEAHFETNPKRFENKVELNRRMTEILIKEPRSHWQKKLDDVGIPNSPIQLVDEVLNDPQTQSLGIVQESVEHAMKLVGLPMKFNGQRPPLQNEAPALGADNDTYKN